MARPSHAYVAVDNKTLHDTQLLLKESDARSRVMFIKLHNIQVEMSQLKMSLDKLAAALLELAKTDSIPATEAEAVIRDFLFNKHK